MKRRYWWILGVIVLGGAIALGVRSCLYPGFNADYLADEDQDALKSGLSLKDVTLEQQDDNGQILWRVKAEEVAYSPDQKSADLLRPEGELYQDGQLLYRVKADTGVIQENGQVILLRGHIVATGIQNQTELKGDLLEWRPKQEVMFMRNGIIGNHPQVRLQAENVSVYDREKRMVLQGKVIANSVVANPQVDPWLKLHSDQMEWRWEAGTLTSPEALKAERLQNASVTEVLTGQQGQADLKANRVTVTDNIVVKILDIPLDITSETATWNIDTETIDVDQPLKIINAADDLTLTAQQGQVNIAANTLYLSQDVVLVGDTSGDRLTTDRLTWNFIDQTVLAEGNVNYRQTNPTVTVRGPRARGRIEEKTIVVDGGRVTTEIIPADN